MHLGKGTCFGERSFLTGEPIAKDVHVSETFTMLLVMNERDFVSLPTSLFDLFHEKLTELQLRTHPVMQDIDETRKKEVQQAFKIRKFESCTIVQEGQVGSYFYIVKQGTCCVLKKKRRHGKKNKGAPTQLYDQFICDLKVNDIFGEGALLNEEGTLCNATVVARGEVACYVMDKVHFRKYFSKTKYFMNQMEARVLAKRGVSINHCDTYDFEKLSLVLRRPLCVGYLVRHKDTEALLLQRAYVKRNLEMHNRFSQCQSERRLLLETRHPFIVYLLRTFQDAAHVYFLEEWLPGGDVLSLICREQARGRNIPPEQAKMYASCTLLALGSLRLRDIVCRSVTPENVFIASNGLAKLANFHFAKKLHGAKTFTVFGTPEYMPPEQIFGAGQTCASDLWQFGIFIHEMLVGHTPFHVPDSDASSHQRVYANILMGYAEHQSALVTDNSAQLLLDCLLVPDGSRRLGAKEISDLNSAGWFKDVNMGALYDQRVDTLPKESLWVPPFNRENLSQWYMTKSKSDMKILVNGIEVKEDVSNDDTCHEPSGPPRTFGDDDGADDAMSGPNLAQYQRHWYDEF